MQHIYSTISLTLYLLQILECETFETKKSQSTDFEIKENINIFKMRIFLKFFFIYTNMNGEQCWIYFNSVTT